MPHPGSCVGSAPVLLSVLLMAACASECKVADGTTSRLRTCIDIVRSFKVELSIGRCCQQSAVDDRYYWDQLTKYSSNIVLVVVH